MNLELKPLNFDWIQMVKLKKLTGYFLIAVSVPAIIGWAYTAFNAKELVGSPYLWFLFPIMLFVGVYLAAWEPAEKVDSNTQRRIRMRMILVFLAAAAGASLLFLLAHVLMNIHPLPSSRAYVAFAVVVSMGIYIPVYLVWVRKAGYQWRSTFIVPLLFVMGVMFAPVASIDIYNNMHDAVQRVASGKEAMTAESNFIQIDELVLQNKYRLFWRNHWFAHDPDQHGVECWGLVPVDTGRGDTLFTLWIDVRESKKFNSSLGEDTLLKLEKDFTERCRDRVNTFKGDSVLFFDRTKQDARKVLASSRYPLTDQSIVLTPVYQPFEDYRSGNVVGYGATFVVVCLFFWFGSAVNDDD